MEFAVRKRLLRPVSLFSVSFLTMVFVVLYSLQGNYKKRMIFPVSQHKRASRSVWHNVTAADFIRNMTRKRFLTCRHFLPYSYPATKSSEFRTEKQCTRRSPVGHYRTCAIVGNGGILLSSGCGMKIDSNEFVIRVAHSPIESFEKDVGQKVNLTVVNDVFLGKLQKKGIDPNWLRSRNNSIISYVLNHNNNLKTLNDVVRKSHLNITITNSKYPTRALVRKFWNDTRKTFLEVPTAGLITYTLASTFCDVITLYGFYPFGQDWNNRTLLYHYYQSGLAKIFFDKNKLHDYPSEHKILKSLHNLKALKMVTDVCT
ncbi:alpha-2,8-sialyltransferase 8B-like [Branchiostoma floridae]|uniref:Alpha-2,8-sialyltransferase 8B-like n=1 Tax=Branchiostoma floridae TaxID=7739 RepID=A0A9J7KS60_BRAFL|nr:alpha-2,8-sialyltransferase 8B-like [Branchiostoma floridae]